MSTQRLVQSSAENTVKIARVPDVSMEYLITGQEKPSRHTLPPFLPQV
jgi:hypothetical protein